MSVNQLIIRPASNNDIPRAANFLGNYWFNEDIEISKAQRNEFTKLENIDLNKRYSERVGIKKYPSTLLLALLDEDIVGYVYVYILTSHSFHALLYCTLTLVVCMYASYRCVGLDCQRYIPTEQRFVALPDQNYKPLGAVYVHVYNLLSYMKFTFIMTKSS